MQYEVSVPGLKGESAAMGGSKDIFRKSSLDRMSSPEKLNDYIKVSNPSVWIILGAIAAILIAVIIWGVLYETQEGIRPIELLIGR